MLQKIREITSIFKLPIIIILEVILSLVLKVTFHFDNLSNWVLILIVIIGSLPLFKKNILAILYSRIWVPIPIVMSVLI